MNTVKMNFRVKALLTGLGLVHMMAFSHSGLADERESLEQLKATTTNLIDLLVQEGVLSKNKADAMLKKAAEDGARQAQALAAQSKAEAAGAPPVEDGAVRVQYVPEHVKKKLREEIKQEVLAQAKVEKWATPNVIPEWTDRIAFNGDIRLRYENNNFGKNNALPTDLNNPLRFSNIKNTTEDRNRLRARGRLGVDVKVTDWLTGGLRMTTGDLDSPISPNQTLESSTGKFSLGLDRAFLKIQPYSWLTVQGGRFGNPWMHTDLVWDPDLAFDGVAVTLGKDFNKSWSGFATAGAFPIDEIETSQTNLAKDKWLYGAQAGIKWQSANKSSVKVSAAYYDFDNVEGIANPLGLSSNNGTVPAFRQKGNNTFDIERNNLLTPDFGDNDVRRYGLASEFKLINLTGQVDLAMFDPVHVAITGDYVRNIGFNEKSILKRTGNTYAEENVGYQVRLDVGMPSFSSSAINQVKRNDWQVSMGYKRLEADAVLDSYTDSDFHLGGTDAKGWILGANYGLDKNTWISARYFSSDAISGPTFSTDVFLLDLNAKF